MITRRTFRPLAVTVVLLAMLPGTALAHAGHDPGSNLLAGLMHPLTGLDHVLMIVSVGAWAAMQPPRHRWVIAACLALFVAIGALIPIGAGPALEVAIALTVVGAGTLLAMGRRWPLWIAGSIATAFALVHGFAHGAEGPGYSSAYVAGLVFATATLALVASSIAAAGARTLWLRLGGVFAAMMGLSALV